MQSKKCIRITVFGVVQGVGFRPFVRNLAVRLGICGSVRNCGSFVEIIAEGEEPKLREFLASLRKEAPARAKIDGIRSENGTGSGCSGFDILKSRNDAGEVNVSPDIAICENCRRELFDQSDRRYLHPFINCTNCGPRFTILEEMPYDRERTSMARFEMCPDCRKQYGDPEDRRYHAQPVCCNRCGPRLSAFPPSEGDAVTAARRVIMDGGIVAVKGIGGFHVCCDARSRQAVERLRLRKRRPFKPFAVMMKDLAAVRRECRTDEAEEALLSGPQAPVVLLKKRFGGGLVCGEASPGNPEIGVMLPYAPVQLLLFDYPDGIDFTDCLIMTSGNISGLPICVGNREAEERLIPLCDLILLHDRDIRIRADDSVARVYSGSPMLLRRSRGYAPLPIVLDVKSGESVFAAGGDLKNSFCLSKRGRMHLSPYMGDLSDYSTLKALDDTRVKMQRLLEITPTVAACDLHPGYHSSEYAESLRLPVVKVQHHFAHLASCLAENGEYGEAIGVAFDGTGYGTDGTLWGGEFLRVSLRGFERLGCLSPFILSGGDAASVECYRPAVSLLLGAYGGEAEAARLSLELGLCSEKQLSAQLFMIKNGVNSISTSAAGRLFDSVSAVLGIKSRSTFEGEAAMALQFAAENPAAGDVPEIGGVELEEGRPFHLKTAGLVRSLAIKRLAGVPSGVLARIFHEALSSMVAEGCKKCREETGIEKAALSGGVFQNTLLLTLCREKLGKAGFQVLMHRQVPPNDGGIALGQAAAALAAFGRERDGG